jgi:hypothetical protein
MTDTVSFNVSAADAAIIGRIADRAYAADKQTNGRSACSLLEWRMDITACHANGNPLRLDDLLAADDFNFAHDAFGIARHLNRQTGQLENFFSPRFSRREEAAAA